jgi:hypothetical protein
MIIKRTLISASIAIKYARGKITYKNLNSTNFAIGRSISNTYGPISTPFQCIFYNISSLDLKSG